ncbi:MAG: type III secretion system export apparatus subunit SctT [Planctomycetota bacterium]
MVDVGPLREFLTVFAFCVVRLTAACVVAPFLAKQVLPGQARNSLMFAWGLMIYPMVSPTLDAGLPTGPTLLGLIAKEIFLGILIGFLAAKVFWLAMSVGFFIDNQRGASMASVFDPNSGEQTSPLGLLLQQAIIALFYVSGGLLIFLAGVFESYRLWPIDSFYPTLDAGFPLFVLGVVDDLMRATVVLAAPVVIVMFFTDFGLGLVNRFAPQLNVFFLSMSVKGVVALAILVVYLPFLFVYLDREFIDDQVLMNFFQGVVS